AVHNRGFVLGRHDLRRTSEVLQSDGFELAPRLFADDQTAREGGDVAEHGFTTITEPGGFHCQYVEHTTQLIEHQRCQRLAVYVFGDDDNVALADLYQLFQQRHDVLRRADLLVIDQDVRLFNDGFHRLRVGDEVGADVTAIKRHTFDVFGLEFKPFALFNRDHAVLADLIHDFSDQVTDFGILRRNAGDTGDLFLGADGNRLLTDVLGNRFRSREDTALEQHRVRASGDVLQAFVDGCLRQNGCRGRAVACDVVGLGGGFLQKLR